MEAKDVLNLPWGKIDWQNLPRRAGFCGIYVKVSEIYDFVESVYHDISRKLNIPYEELHPILESENAPFYRFLSNWGEETNVFYCHGSDFLNLQNLFRVPMVQFNKVNTCLELFEKLSDMEKIEFLQKIGKISITVQTENMVD